MSADLLSRAVAKLRETESQSVTVFTAEDDGFNINHMIAACGGVHAGDTDQYGCCQDCTFIGGYDGALVAIVAVLLRSRPALAAWLEFEAGLIDDMAAAQFSDAILAARFAASLAVARVILGETAS